MQLPFFGPRRDERALEWFGAFDERVLDLVLAVVAAVLLPPILLMTAVAIKIRKSALAPIQAGITLAKPIHQIGLSTVHKAGADDADGRARRISLAADRLLGVLMGATLDL